MSVGLNTSPPPVTWAQRSSHVFLTINVECDKPDIKFDKTKVHFKGTTSAPDHKLHEIEIPLYAEVDPEKCTYANKGRVIDVVLKKVNSEEPFWPSLTSDNKKHHWLKINFERWQDEEEESEDDSNELFSDKMHDLNDEIDNDGSSSDEEDLDI